MDAQCGGKMDGVGERENERESHITTTLHQVTLLLLKLINGINTTLL